MLQLLLTEPITRDSQAEAGDTLALLDQPLAVQLLQLLPAP